MPRTRLCPVADCRCAIRRRRHARIRGRGRLLDPALLLRRGVNVSDALDVGTPIAPELRFDPIDRCPIAVGALLPVAKLRQSIADSRASEAAFGKKALAARTTREMTALRERQVWWRQRAALRQMVLDARR